MKKKLLLTSILSIVMCLSLIAGATFALFTSESTVNVAVTSGTVKVDAVVSGLEYKTLTKDWMQVADVNDVVEFDGIGGTAKLTDGATLTLDKIVPGDGVRFNVDVDNQSNVTVKYRVIVKNAADSNADLFNALDISINNADFVGVAATDWATIESGKDGVAVPVSIELPKDAENSDTVDLMGKAVNLTIVVEAIQGNAETVNGIEVDSASELLTAIYNVKDGDTITLNTDVTFDENSRTYVSGNYYDGIYYVGDKSFTIDLNGKTMSNDSAINDYLLNFKNDGTKANTITIKNGTVEATSSAFCAVCTSTSSTQQITINLENVNMIGNNSSGSVVKIRGGAVLNVKDGTVIKGNDSYLGIESSNATVNIYDGVEIYQNGSSSYNGCLVGVGFNGIVNVYGGYGKGVAGGFIAMTSGGTINVSGGEWIANTDGMGDGNDYVMIAQNDNKTYPSAGKSIINVAGGTFNGGYNCYGNAVGDAQLNIYAGKFDTDPNKYVVSGCVTTENSDGTWTVVNN